MGDTLRKLMMPHPTLLLAVTGAILAAEPTCTPAPLSFYSRPDALITGRAITSYTLPESGAVDRQGNIYFAEPEAHRIVRIGTDGSIASVAGTGRMGRPGPNPGPDLLYPRAIAVGPDDSIYFVENSTRVRRLKPDLTLEWVAGLGDQSVAFEYSNRPRSAKATHLGVVTSLGINETGRILLAELNGALIFIETDGTLVASQFTPRPGRLNGAAPLRNGRWVVQSSDIYRIVLEDGRMGPETDASRLRGIAGTLRSLPNGDVTFISWAGLGASSLLRWTGEGTSTLVRNLPADFRGTLGLVLPGDDVLIQTASDGIVKVTPSGARVRITMPPPVADPRGEGSLESVFLYSGLFANVQIPHPQSKIAHYNTDGVWIIEAGTVRRLIGGGTAVPAVGASATEVRLRPEGAAFDASGRLFAYAAEQGRVFQLDPGGKLTDPFPGKPFAVTPTSSYSNFNLLAYSDSYLYLGKPGGSHLISYSLDSGEMAEFPIGSQGQLLRISAERSLLYSPQSSAYARALIPTAVGEAVPAFELQDEVTRVVRRGNVAYHAGGGLYRRDADGRWRKLLPDFGLLPSLVSAIYESADGSLTLLNGGVLMRLDDPESCPSRPLPFFAGPGRLANLAGYSDIDRVSPYGLVTLFAEDLNAGIPISELRTSASPIVSHPDYVRLAFGTGTPHRLLLPFAVSERQASYLVWKEDRTISGNPPLPLCVYSEGIRYCYPGPVQVVDATPGLFVQGSGRDGVAAALNQDGTVHGEANPAAPGTIVSLYATGLGEVRLGGPQPAASPILETINQFPALPVEVKIGGEPVDLQYRGFLTGQLIGLWQLNVRIPANAKGIVPVEVMAGDQSTATRQRVTLFVR